MRQRPIKLRFRGQGRVLPAALLAFGVVMTLGSLGDAALAMAVCSREAALTRSETDAAVTQFLASLGSVATKPAPSQAAIPATHPPQLASAPRRLFAPVCPILHADLAVQLPHLLDLPPPQA